MAQEEMCELSLGAYSILSGRNEKGVQLEQNKPCMLKVGQTLVTTLSLDVIVQFNENDI